MSTARLHRQTLAGWGFLLPNIVGLVGFVLVPLVASLVMAFTNWDLRHHNMFKHEPLAIVGLGNFRRLLADPAFWGYLRNTLYLMAGIPFCIAGSLVLALMLSRDLGARRRHARAMLVLLAVVAVAVACLVAGGARGTALMLGIVWAGVLLAGVAGGSYTYRTLLFIPAFTNGVAVFLLWKKLYNPTNGPVNAALSIALGVVQSATLAAPPAVVTVGATLLLILMAVTAGMAFIGRVARAVHQRDLRPLHAAVCVGIAAAPALLDRSWLAGWPGLIHGGLLLCAAAAALIVVGRTVFTTSPFPAANEPASGYLLLALVVALAQVGLLGLASVARLLPAMAHQGLAPPNWLSSYAWAKPALILVGFWASVGSGNMLLYLAALSNVPQELYEAADMDGAPPLSRFWNVTFPQLGPTTFFIVIMSVIGGIQGGFEIARAMTNGGPAESTTTLSFFIYRSAFEDGRLGYASAAAWLLCLFVFTVTLVNWSVGSRYVND
jgi:multiple sugar transport system permease protein